MFTINTDLHTTKRFAKWETHPFLTTLKNLLQIPSPPAHEWYMAEYLRQQIIQLGFNPKIDPMGNIEVHIPGANPSAPKYMLAAHIDEIALVVTQIEPNGNLRVTNSGGITPEKLG